MICPHWCAADHRDPHTRPGHVSAVTQVRSVTGTIFRVRSVLSETDGRAARPTDQFVAIEGVDVVSRRAFSHLLGLRDGLHLAAAIRGAVWV